MSFVKPDFEFLSSREWLVTNGIGGYASSSLCGANTRRYHGLLVASFNPPTDRRVIVSKVEEKISIDKEDFLISTNQYPGVIHPDGFQWLKSFERNPFPRCVFSNDTFSITKTVFMVYGTNTTVIEYQNTGKKSFDLELTPLFVYRNYHSLFHEADGVDFLIENVEHGKLEISPNNDNRPFYVRFTNGQFILNPDWYRNFEYHWEKERGLDFQEDAKSIGQINCNLKSQERIYLIFSTDEQLPDDEPAAWKAKEELRLSSLIPSVQHDFIRDLAVSGDQFLVWRLSSGSFTLIAGYHWFTDWGRDTMIAMRGLVIALGKKQVAQSIFRTFLQYLDHGMIPNRFPDKGEQPEYNTIDATLWLFVALYEYHATFDDSQFIREVFPKLTDIINAHIEGTRYTIHVTKEGLLSGGEEFSQLTWMDAKIGDHVVTPRRGCAVEINALWYNALSIYVEFGKYLDHPVTDIEKMIAPLRRAFRKYFVNKKGYLNDVIIPGSHVDDAIRPNQVYAISLPFTPLTDEEAKGVLHIIEKHLYTDLGLRSLSKDHPDFKPIYTGNQWQRDHAYHQGTVWAFLWGEYAMAFLNVNDHSAKSKRVIRKKAKTLEQHFYHENCLYGISEIFDGEHPGNGKGCIHQAWSVGMTLKALLACESRLHG